MVRVAAIDPGEVATFAPVYATAGGADAGPSWSFLAALPDQPSGRAWGLWLGERGAAAAWFLGVAPEAELVDVRVASDLRGRGLGRRLLQSALAELEVAGIRRVFLEVRESNQPARALYRQLGFADTGRRRDYYRRSSGPEDAMLMTLEMTGREQPQ